MIEKLDLDRRHSFGTVDWLEHMNEPSGAKLVEQKVNQLIDVINALVEENNIHEKQIDELQMKQDNRMIGSVTFDKIEGKINSKPADTFAEQKKWIGKLCRFWDDEGNSHFSILVDIHKPAPYPYCCEGDWWYQHCEPVEPDDSIIYKGELK